MQLDVKCVRNGALKGIQCNCIICIVIMYICLNSLGPRLKRKIKFSDCHIIRTLQSLYTFCYRNGWRYGTSWNGILLWSCSGLWFSFRSQHGRSRSRGCTAVCSGDVRGSRSTCSGESMLLVNKHAFPATKPVPPCIQSSRRVDSLISLVRT